MDLVNRAYTLLYDRLRSLTPSGRLTVCAAALLVLLGTAFLSVRDASPTYVDLMHGVPIAAVDLPAMEAALGKAKLKQYEVRGASIYVPRGQEADYMAALASAKALPKRIGAALFDAVTSGSWYDIGSQRDCERLKIAKQEVLSQAIGEMRGVESAYVLFDVDNRPGGFKEKIITASACVKPAGPGALDDRLIPAIRDMLVGAIAGLKPENVTVLDLSGHTWRGSSHDQLDTSEYRYHSLKRIYEQDLKAKILSALSYIPDVRVETNVEFSSVPAPRKPVPDAGNTANDPQISIAATTNSGHATSAAPNSIQQPNVAAMLKAVLAASPDDKSTAVAMPPRNETKPEGQTIAPTPNSARASVSIPMSYFCEVWRAAHAGSQAAEPDLAALEQVRVHESSKIQKHVAQLLPTSDTLASTLETVTVTAIPDVATEKPQSPISVEVLLHKAGQSWRMIGIVALALTALWMFRSMVRPRPSPTEADATPDEVESDVLEAHPRPQRIPRPHARRFDPAHPSTRDDISKLIEHDPDAAANVLRNWIGQVG